MGDDEPILEPERERFRLIEVPLPELEMFIAGFAPLALDAVLSEFGRAGGDLGRSRSSISAWEAARTALAFFLPSLMDASDESLWIDAPTAKDSVESLLVEGWVEAIPSSEKAVCDRLTL